MATEIRVGMLTSATSADWPKKQSEIEKSSERHRARSKIDIDGAVACLMVDQERYMREMSSTDDFERAAKLITELASHWDEVDFVTLLAVALAQVAQETMSPSFSVVAEVASQIHLEGQRNGKISRRRVAEVAAWLGMADGSEGERPGPALLFRIFLGCVAILHRRISGTLPPVKSGRERMWLNPFQHIACSTQVSVMVSKIAENLPLGNLLSPGDLKWAGWVSVAFARHLLGQLSYARAQLSQEGEIFNPEKLREYVLKRVGGKLTRDPLSFCPCHEADQGLHGRELCRSS